MAGARARAQMAASPRQRAASAEALYLRVARELRGDIASNRFAIGSILPTEAELCQRFGVSRHTVREALRCLRDSGLVQSRQGSGTMVLPSTSAHALSLDVSSVEDLAALMPGTRLRVLSSELVRIDAPTAERVGLEPGSEWLVVTGLGEKVGVETPLCWCEHFIHKDYASVARAIDLYAGAVFVLIEDMFKIRVSEVEMSVVAGLVDPALAPLLAVQEDCVAVTVRRTFKLADGQIVQTTRHVHPADRFSYHTVMHRQNART